MEDYASSSIGDSTSTGKIELDNAATSAIALAASFLQHVANPPRPVYQRVSVERDRAAVNERLMKDYFDPVAPQYNEASFRRWFRMSSRLFLRIAQDLEREKPYFQQRCDARGKMGFTAIQKCTSTLRILGYGNATDIKYEYLKMGEKTTRDSMENYCKCIIDLYGECYLRKPTWLDLQKIYDVHEEVHGLPGMIGSIDCMHWQWANCPNTWRGQFTRCGQKGSSVILQAVASYDLWIWNAYFGSVGSNNDINVLEASPIIEDRVAGNAPETSFFVNGSYYPFGYYLGDVIYLELPMIIKTFRDPIDEKRAYFKKVQESSRKDIERLFRVLKKRWHFVSNLCRLGSKEKMTYVMYACLILHNMILEDDGKAYCQDYTPGYVEPERERISMEERIANSNFMHNKEAHYALTADLVEYYWLNHRVTRDD